MRGQPAVAYKMGDDESGVRCDWRTKLHEHSGAANDAANRRAMLRRLLANPETYGMCAMYEQCRIGVAGVKECNAFMDQADKIATTVKTVSRFVHTWKDDVLADNDPRC